MALQNGIDFLLVKRAGYFDGRRTLQQHGNLVATRNRIIINVLQTLDVLEKMESGRATSSNPFKEIKLATQDMKQSFRDAKDDFRKRKDIATCYQILQEIASEAKSITELEQRAAAMGEDNPKSMNIPLSDIASFKFGWIGPVKITLNSGYVLKIFITKGRKEVKKFLGY